MSGTEKLDAPMNETNAWARLTTAELGTKLRELRKLIDSGILTDRSADRQLAEIAIIENELARRNQG